MNRRKGVTMLAGLLATGAAAVAFARPEPAPTPPPHRPVTVPDKRPQIELPPDWTPPKIQVEPPIEPAEPPYQAPYEPPVEPPEPVHPVTPVAPDPDIDRMLDHQVDDIIRDNADRAIGNSEGW